MDESGRSRRGRGTGRWGAAAHEGVVVGGKGMGLWLLLHGCLSLRRGGCVLPEWGLLHVRQRLLSFLSSQPGLLLLLVALVVVLHGPLPLSRLLLDGLLVHLFL